MSYQVLILKGVQEYINKLDRKHQDKILDFVRLLEEKNGILDEPYSKHLRGKIRELRIGLGGANHRILYSFLPDQKIILLLAFLKITKKTPEKFIDKAAAIYKEFIKLKYEKYNH